MKRLLTAKAWQLILATVVIPFILLIIIEVARNFIYAWQSGEGTPVGETSWTLYLVFVWFFSIFSLPFLWQYQVGTKLTKKLADGRTYFDRKFRLAIIVPAVVLTVLTLITIIQETEVYGPMGPEPRSESDAQAILFVLVLLTYLIGFYFRYRQMGKTLHWVDVASGKRPRDNAVNLLLSLFWWVGIWFLQPRVRAAWKSQQERNLEDHFIE